jgi:hypothetical protein
VIARLIVLWLAVVLAGGAAAQGKKRIERAADLPRFSYTLEGRVEEMVRDDARFSSFAAKLRRDLESVVAQYEIEDKATLRQILSELARLDLLDGDNNAAIARADKVKLLEEKPADRYLSGITVRAIAAGMRVSADRTTAAYRAAVAQSIKGELAAMPYEVIANSAKEINASVELLSEGPLIGNVRELLQPSVDKAGDEASFTSYGPTVVVHANGYQIDSVIPGGERVAESGTSMASPQVVNLAAKILAVDPRLTPAQVIALIRDHADRSPDGRRKLINPAKALAAVTPRKAS